MPDPTAQPFLTPDDLAARWHVNKKTVLTAISRYEIPCTKLGRRWLIPLSWVEAEETRTTVPPRRRRTSVA